MTNKNLRTLVFLIQKGGVGKTTSVKNLAAALSLLGKKCLVIDFDPQANATLGLIGNEIDSKRSVYHLLMGKNQSWQDYLTRYEKGNVAFDLIQGGNNLAFAELELAAKPARELWFRNKILSKIEEESNYDFVLVDCQPSLGLLVINVLCSSNNNELVICGRPDEDSQEAIKFLFNSISSLREDIGVMPRDFKILLTQVSEKQLSHRKNYNQIDSDFPDNMFLNFIKKDTELEKARDARLDIFNYNPQSEAARKYMLIAKEIIGEIKQ